MSKLLTTSALILGIVSLSNQVNVANTNFLSVAQTEKPSSLVAQTMKTSSLVAQKPIIIKPSTLYFNVDDEVTKIFINGNQIQFNFSCNEAGIWDKTHTQTFYLFGGDKLTVVGKDTKKNITGFLGTIHYFNKYGVENIINTGVGWTCDDKPATLKGKNDGSIPGWPNMKLIDTDAQWIWNDKPLQTGVEISCTYQIPCDL